MENQNKKVSIIISFYNEEKYLGEAITSVLESTYKNVELILINDGSTDDSENVVKSFSDNRIVYKAVETNRGQANGRNIGLEISTGEYISFFDGDDIIEGDSIRKRVDYLDQHPDIILVSGGYDLMDGNGQVYDSGIPKELDDVSIRAKMLFKNCISLGGALFRRKLIDEYGIRNDISLRSSQDYKFFLECLPYGRVLNLNESLYFYRHSVGYVSQTTKNRQKKKYDKDMGRLFFGAWRQRGIKISISDAKFIYNHFYKSRRIIYPHDKIKNYFLKRKIKCNLNHLDLLEGEKIMTLYEFFETKRKKKIIEKWIKK